MAQIIVTSFGYGHGAPPTDAHLTYDLRDQIRNPADDPAMIHMTGADRRVRDHVLGTRGADALIDTIARDALDQAPWYDGQHRLLIVAIGCSGGRHRAVVVASEVGRRLQESGWDVEVEHRDIDKPVLARGGR